MDKKELMRQVNNWKEKSEASKVCGIFGCEGKPSVYCPHCGNWYCDDHKFVLELPGHPINKIEIVKIE